MSILRGCSRSLGAAANCVRMGRRNRILNKVNKGFECCPSVTGNGVMSLVRLIFWIFPFICCNVTAAQKGPGLGKPASSELIKQWNMDIFPNGKGLPKGQGTAVAGGNVYKKHCLSCHGVDGTGASADELAGAAHTLTDNPPDKTIGTYWPYATTLFDFNRRTMPLNSPGILTNNELYAVTAYLLYLNGIIDQDKIINARSLAKIKMPNRNGFISIYKQQGK